MELTKIFSTFWYRILLIPILFQLQVLIAGVEATETIDDNTSSNDGSSSVSCSTFTFPIRINATNSKILRDEPSNQLEVSQIIQSVVTPNGTILQEVTGPPTQIIGQFNVSGNLCLPCGSSSSDRHHINRTVLVMTAGIGLDKNYWDIAQTYSFQEAAAKAGYASLAYDRLGTGASQYPDPIQVAQSPTDVEVLHAVIGSLRSGSIAKTAYNNVIGVGHSYGSIVHIGNNAKYPLDMNASVLTGVSNTLNFLPSVLLSTTPTIASASNATAFGKLQTGYLYDPTVASFAQPFFFYPHYDASIFQISFDNRATYSLGLVFTIGDIYAPATNYQRPVAVQLGEEDFAFCGGNCSSPVDYAQALITQFYPQAAKSSKSFHVPLTGHVINAHRNRGQAFSQITNFIKGLGY